MIDAIITARKGSKRLPGKNIKSFCGKPLIAWTIEAALKSSYVNRVFVSTDSKEIAEISKTYGATVPSLRPSFLSEDDSSSVDVVLYFKKYISQDDLLLLQPTSPLRNYKYIDNFMQYIKEQNCVQCVAVKETTKNVKIMYEVENEILSKFSAKDCKYLVPNGSMYYTTFNQLDISKTFLSKKSKYFIMPDMNSIDIDTIEDWNYAEACMNYLVRFSDF